MRGEFIEVWSETKRELWDNLAAHESAARDDLFVELFRELAKAFKNPPTVEALADVISDPVRASEAFNTTIANDFASERDLVTALEHIYEVLEELEGDALANFYFNLLAQFIDKYSLRYDLRRPCTLCPTLVGVFSSLLLDLRTITRQDANLNQLMNEFEDAVRDLRHGCTDGRIKTCIGKQLMLLEGLARATPGVKEQTLGDICNELKTWPHVTVRESLKKLYGFASDYPGIRHGTNFEGVLRAIEMRDMVAICILLAGFTPYLTNGIDSDAVYRGA